MRWRRRNRRRRASDILSQNDGSAPWAFVEGSISVTASILLADVIARCSRCGGQPVIGYFKRLTEQEDGVIIAGMALLFPTALAFYLGGKMVFSAYRDYKRWRDAWREEMREEGREEGREEERARQKRALEELGVTLPPEAEKILFGETDDRS
jgi:hypothetical protein